MTISRLLGELTSRIRDGADDPYYACPELEWVLEYLIIHHAHSKDLREMADEYIATFNESKR